MPFTAEDLREVIKELDGAGLLAKPGKKEKPVKIEFLDVIKELDDAGLQIRYKNDPASTSLTSTGALQGPLQGNPSLGGAMSMPGVRPDRFSAMPRVRTLSKQLTPMPSDYYNEIISIVTGATATTGTNPTSFCGTAPVAGDMKTCQQTYQFGKYFMQTKLNSMPDVGMLRNRAEVPGRILNSAPEDYPLIPDIMWRLVDTRSVFQYEMFMQGVAMERSLEPVLVKGNETKLNTATETGWIKEFKGLDRQIKEGYADVDGTVCPALDSIVMDFGSSLIGDTAGGGDGRTITNMVSDLWYAHQDRAGQVKLDESLEVGFLMRKEMFRVLTDYYANTYATARFQAATMTAGSPVLQLADQANNFRLEMLQGQYLLVEGVPVPVVFSDGLPFDGQGNNVYQSDLMLIPINWQGMPLLRLEFFNLGNEYITEWNGFLNPDKRRVLNNGMYQMGYQSTGMCDLYLFAAKMRLILETPFLAGRIDNINFTYLAKTRNAIPGQSLYANGGHSYYTPDVSYA